jgi:hypothetical protein
MSIDMRLTMFAFSALVALAACDVGDEQTSITTVESALSLPLFHGRFGSPTIVRDKDTLHAYFAIQKFDQQTVHVTHAKSDDDGKTWVRVGEALPHLNKLAVESGAVWAPGAAQISDNEWMLYYTAVRAGTDSKMCIYRAHADTAHGPFVDDFDGPLVCPDGSLWAIDPYPVKNARGDWFLLARIDEPGGNNTIELRALTPNGRHFADGSSWSTLSHINQGGWEEPVMENAAIVRLEGPGGQKRWYEFYSGNSYKTEHYAIGYADCGTSIQGPCVKKTVDAPWMKSMPDIHAYGPGTPTFFRDANGDMLMAVNTWKFAGGESNPKNQGQIMHIFEVHIGADGVPVAKFVRMVE